MKRNPNGRILWESEHIVLIATGLVKASDNRKTGAMVQTWILRKDMPPTEAVQTGADDVICGDCPMRGVLGKGRACYVNVGQAPLAIWQAYRAGSYAVADDIPGLFKGKRVRLGAYGDPAMVPYDVLRDIVSGARMWTGYTHQWRGISAAYADMLMASCETEDDLAAAREAGYRAFVVVPEHGDFPTGTVECMNTANGVTCADCGACAGTRMGAKPAAVSIAIRAHGTGKRYV